MTISLVLDRQVHFFTVIIPKHMTSNFPILYSCLEMPHAAPFAEKVTWWQQPLCVHNNHVEVLLSKIQNSQLLSDCEGLSVTTPTTCRQRTQPSSFVLFFKWRDAISEVIWVAQSGFKSFLCLCLFLRIRISNAAIQTHKMFSDIRSAEDLNVRELYVTHGDAWREMCMCQ